MTTEIDAEGLAAARAEVRRALMSGEVGTMGAADVAIHAYLSASRSTSEAEPVRWLGLPAVKLANRGLNALYAEVPELVARDVSKLVLDAFDAIAANSLPTPASDDQVEAVRDVNAFAAAAMAALVAYEADYGGPLPDDHELGRIEDSRGSPSFRIRVGHIRRLAAMGSTKK